MYYCPTKRAFIVLLITASVFLILVCAANVFYEAIITEHTESQDNSKEKSEEITYEPTEDSYTLLYCIIGEKVIKHTEDYLNGITTASTANNNILVILNYSISNNTPATQKNIDICNACFDICQCLIDIQDYGEELYYNDLIEYRNELAELVGIDR